MHVHLIAIGGSVMHNLAIALKSAGHSVSGSDDEIYNPAKDRLAAIGLLPEREGWFPEKITSDLDCVILGMHARRDNPELLAAQECGVRVLSYPEFIYDFSKDKKRLVVAGSHGKTTTVAMTMHCLKRQKIDFDYVVGARVEGFEHSVRLSDAPVIVIEGDEYPASPLDLLPKMVHYRPHAAVVTGIAWDHVNVYPTFEAYCEQFGKLIDALEPEANLIWYSADPELKKLVEARKGDAKFYSVPYEPFPAIVQRGQQIIKMWGKPRVPMQAFGNHNLANAKGAFMLCRELGVWIEDFMRDLASFKGAGRRLQLLTESRFCTAWEDFAHAPSKVKATVEAVKTLYPDRPLVACLELHTFSSLNKAFLPQYAGALNPAEKAFVFFSPHTLAMKKLPEITPDDIKTAFNHPDLEVFTENADLVAALEKQEWFARNLLFMSSGNFGGLEIAKIAQELLW